MIPMKMPALQMETKTKHIRDPHPFKFLDMKLRAARIMRMRKARKTRPPTGKV
jgi:hypothetical protein